MKTIKLKELDVKIRRAKVKEVKKLIEDMATKFTEVANFIYNTPMTDEEFMEKLPGFIIEYMEFFEKYTVKFTIDFTHENFEELEITDALKLIKEIAVYNGISEDFIKSFFTNFKQVSKEQATERQFVKGIPKTEETKA